MMYNKDRTDILPLKIKTKHLRTGYDVIFNGSKLQEFSFFGKGVQNQVKALHTRQFASSIPIDLGVLNEFDRICDEIFSDFD